MHEVRKLQTMLSEMQLQVEETKSMLIRERDAARKATEAAPPVIKETTILVQDMEKINSLTAQVEQLKVELLISFCLYCSLDGKSEYVRYYGEDKKFFETYQLKCNIYLLWKI